MLKVENIEVVGFEPAIRGMRNPKNSWHRSDSFILNNNIVGENDMKLMQGLAKAGTEHRKYARMIQVYCDITAPLYWWKEFDTYKVGTVANSCSTMHKIHDKEFTLDDFSTERLSDEALWVLSKVLEQLNISRNCYNSAFKDVTITWEQDYWWDMIQLLPTSYNQRRTVMFNYEVAARIIEQRSQHKLDEWHTLVAELHKLPYLDEIFGFGDGND